MAAVAAPPNPEIHSARNSDVQIQQIPLSKIETSILNPRKAFNEEAIAELAGSIEEHGLLQPLTLRPHRDVFVVVAGERRLRAVRLLDWLSVPAIVREDLDDVAHLTISLIENLQRQDLDPIEEALGYSQLHKVVGLKQSEIAAAVNRSQPAIANTMRLLELPQPVIDLVRERKLTPAHGKALLKFSKWPELLEAIAAAAVEEGWTSKDLEAGIQTDWRGPGIPGDFLVDAKLLVSLGWGADLTALKAAGITVWDSGHAGNRTYTPDVDELPAALEQIEKAKQAEISRALEQARSRAKAEGKELVRLEKLPYNSYEQVNTYNWPKACGKDCECRALAQDSTGEIVEISTDPAHVQKLRTAESRERSKKDKAGRRGAVETLKQLLDEAPPLDHRGIAIVVGDRLWQFRKPVRAQLVERHLQGILTEERLSDWNGRRDIVDQLMKMPLVTLLKILVEGVLLDDMDSHLQYGGMSTQLSWYMREGGGDPFHGDSLESLKTRLQEAKAMASNTMNLPGQQQMWKETAAAIQRRITEVEEQSGKKAS